MQNLEQEAPRQTQFLTQAQHFLYLQSAPCPATTAVFSDKYAQRTWRPAHLGTLGIFVVMRHDVSPAAGG